MPEQAGTEFDVDAVRRMREQIGAQDGEDALEYPDGHEADDKHVERAHTAMYEHLVDDDLEEHRRDQREHLQEERGDEYLAEEVAVFVNGTEKPGDVEPAREIEQACAPRHQDQTPVPDRLQFLPRHERRPRG